MFMPRCREYIERYEGPTATATAGLPEEAARWFFQQLVLAVDYCHSLGIAHRDIKLENALLDRQGPRAILKLCDFGAPPLALRSSSYHKHNQCDNDKACVSGMGNCRRSPAC